MSWSSSIKREVSQAQPNIIISNTANFKSHAVVADYNTQNILKQGHKSSYDGQQQQLLNISRDFEPFHIITIYGLSPTRSNPTFWGRLSLIIIIIIYTYIYIRVNKDDNIPFPCDLPPPLPTHSPASSSAFNAQGRQKLPLNSTILPPSICQFQMRTTGTDIVLYNTTTTHTPAEQAMYSNE